MRVRGGTGFERITRALAGTTLDFSAIIVPIAVIVLLASVLVALKTRARWQHHGPTLLIIPCCVALYLITVTEQEVKAERGAFSTLQEIAGGVAESSFVEGSLGFFRYERIWLPAIACSAVAIAFLVMRVRRERDGEHLPRRAWSAGVVTVFASGALLAPGYLAVQGAISPRLSAAAMGDPLTSLLETSIDLVQHRVPAKPAELLLQLQPTDDEVATGAARLGWPPVHDGPHLHARPLDPAKEGAAPATPLLHALEQVSAALFADGDGKVAVFQFSLESFRADDLHALHPAAPVGLAPFVNGLYEQRAGVLASRRTFQAGVRTAQGLAAMTCGLGTLPYNLSLIRDLDAFPLRCAPDVLADSGFHGSFFYGSDATYDQMARFVTGHGLTTIVSQDELPSNLPKGAWSGLTDFVIFDEAANRAAQGLTDSPQLSLVMSLSNHSPYTAPEDLPETIRRRVALSVESVPNRAQKDEQRRLVTYAYTDAALERFFARLETLGIAERSIVVLLADHSTGEDYVWGPDDVEHETDAAKAQVPFLIVIPPAFLSRVKDRAALDAALSEAQRLLDTTTLSQNDVPTLLLALMSAHPGVKALPEALRWHSLGGQISSPWFKPGGDPASFLVGINGVDQLYVLDANGARVGAYEDAVFLRTRADRAHVTPRLIPVAATLVHALRNIVVAPKR